MYNINEPIGAYIVRGPPTGRISTCVYMQDRFSSVEKIWKIYSENVL